MRQLLCIAPLAVACTATAVSAQTPARPNEQGKIVSMQGQVQHTEAAREAWNRARVFQPLFTKERVRTLTASRAAVLFLDETQVKLNAGAVLTIEDVRRESGGPTTFQLLQGEGWFRTKNPKSGVTVRTPTAAAAIRGTEINLLVRAGETVLTVVEGSAEFSNEQGAILVNAGEEATARPGAAPTKRVMLNPEDAVQWALYYPAELSFGDLPQAATTGAGRTGFERLRARDAAGALQAFSTAGDDAWSRIGASIAHLQLGDAAQARAVLAGLTGVTGPAAVERHAQLAAAALAAGDAAAARREIDAALAIDPTAVRPLVLLSSLELRRNRAEESRTAAERALAAHPDAVSALVAAAEAVQATFDLAGARRLLDRALRADPRDVRALVNRARIRFGTGDTSGARRDAAQAAALAPDDPQLRSLLGFIRLADGAARDAAADFQAAIRASADLGEPHLGLGLVHFRDGNENEGLLEMLTATLLEPKVSLYQSYLGKAYYQLQRFPEGLSALATAKRLDPRDPTPWLYSSLFLRDQNRQVDALNELRHAIALNDNRAVYRSRLLLDRDLATKNVSLAEIYRQLGFDAWGAHEALNSLETDFTNASAHLFLAETYGNLPDRTQALGSELLQYFIYAPVNRNSFNNFSEYTALLEQPRQQLTFIGETGTRERAFGDLAHRSGNERFAHVAFIQTSRQDSPRLQDGDERTQGFVQGKVALGSQSDLFFTFNGARNDYGATDAATDSFGLESGQPIVLRRFTETPDPRVTNRSRIAEGTIGFKHMWRPGSAFAATARYLDINQALENSRGAFSACSGLPLAPFAAHAVSRLATPIRSFDLQAQQATRLGRHQLIAGAQMLRMRKGRDCVESIVLDAIGETLLRLDQHRNVRDRGSITYVRDEIQVARRVHASIGVAYQQIEYADPFSTTAAPLDLGQWSPSAGIAVRLSPRTVVRAAGFRNLNINFVGSKISPTSVMGFVTDRNEFPTARRNEGDASIETARGRTFFGVRTFVRDTTVPLLLASGGLVPEADTRDVGAVGYLNLIATRRVSVFGENQLVRVDTNAFRRVDNLARVGVNFIHERGVFGRLSVSHVTQRFGRTVVADLPRESVPLIDGSVSYEFAGKRGLLSLVLFNLLDRRFATVVEGLAVNELLPRRRAFLSIRWRVF